MAFADSGRAYQQDVAGFGDEPAGGELMNAVARDAGIEAEVEAVEGARFPEVGAFIAPGGGAVFAHGEFVLEEEFEELAVGQPVGGGFQQAGFERFGEAAETELAGVGFEGDDLAHDAFLEVIPGSVMSSAGGSAGVAGAGWKKSLSGAWRRMKSA